MPYETQYINALQSESVQKLPDIKKNKNTGRLIYGTGSRGPILPHYGTREREYELLAYYRNDYNGLYRSALGGLIKRIQSMPYEIKGEAERAKHFQRVFMQADFGGGWDSLISKSVKDYNRYDGGAYIEVIGRGEVEKPLYGAIMGLAVLDSLRCYPTGDPEYPVAYYDYDGKLHYMHFTRVIRFYDMQDSDDSGYGKYGHSYGVYKGYGECSLSRGISAVTREILINRYVEQELDDNPKPGLLLFKNIAERQLNDAVAKMENERNTDSRGRWGHTIKIFGLDPSQAPEVENVTYSNPPEKFDYETYKNINAKEIAAAIGLDIQDFWELTGNNLGTATQSQVLAEKSKGNALGHTMKELERVFNQLLPEDMEFAFKYTDPEEDQQEADKAATWITNVTTLVQNGIATPEQAQRLLANQVPAIMDVITDESGEIIRLPDSDPKGEPQDVIVQDSTSNTAEDATIQEDKALRTVQSSFRQVFKNLISQATGGEADKALVRSILRTQLQVHGEEAYIEGLRDGGMEAPGLDDTANKEIATWRAAQTPFIRKFVDELFTQDGFSVSKAQQRADMWVNKSLNPLYYVALGNADKNKLYMWVYDPRKEHCDDCLRLNGQIHRMKDYVKKGILPQSPALECGGYHCGCSLVPSQMSARGRIGGKPSGIRGIFNRILNLFKKG